MLAAGATHDYLTMKVSGLYVPCLQGECMHGSFGRCFLPQLACAHTYMHMWWSYLRLWYMFVYHQLAHTVGEHACGAGACYNLHCAQRCMQCGGGGGGKCAVQYMCTHTSIPHHAYNASYSVLYNIISDHHGKVVLQFSRLNCTYIAHCTLQSII